MKIGLLGRLAENNAKKEQNVVKEAPKPNEEIISFEFEGKTYYVAVRDNVLIFDSNMVLFHTLSKEDVVASDIPLIQKVNETILSKDEPRVKLFIKRDGTFEKISFYNRFDAIFILKKLKRVATRPDENIEELFIEDDGALVEHFSTKPQRRLAKGLFKNRKESRVVEKLVDVEETLETIISTSINNPSSKLAPEDIDRCIELLESFKQDEFNIE